jgi:hypothetical protein
MFSGRSARAAAHGSELAADESPDDGAVSMSSNKGSL